MKISKSELISLTCDQNIINSFIHETNNTDQPVEIVSLLDSSIKTSSLVWIVCKKLIDIDALKIVKMSCDFALINVSLFDSNIINDVLISKGYDNVYTNKQIIDFLQNPYKFTIASRVSLYEYAGMFDSVYFGLINNTNHSARDKNKITREIINSKIVHMTASMHACKAIWRAAGAAAGENCPIESAEYAAIESMRASLNSRGHIIDILKNLIKTV